MVLFYTELREFDSFLPYLGLVVHNISINSIRIINFQFSKFHSKNIRQLFGASSNKNFLGQIGCSDPYGYIPFSCLVKKPLLNSLFSRLKKQGLVVFDPVSKTIKTKINSIDYSFTFSVNVYFPYVRREAGS